MFQKPKKTQAEQLRQQLADLKIAREQIIEQSTERRLAKLDEEARSLRSSLYDCEKAEASAKSASQPSDEENSLWESIRESIDREANIIRQVRLLPEKFIRADAVDFFEKDLLKRGKEIDEQLAEIKGVTSMGPRLRKQVNEYDAEKQTFASKTKSLCVAGEKIHQLRAEREKLNAKRDKLRAEREAEAVQSV